MAVKNGHHRNCPACARRLTALEYVSRCMDPKAKPARSAKLKAVFTRIAMKDLAIRIDHIEKLLGIHPGPDQKHRGVHVRKSN